MKQHVVMISRNYFRRRINMSDIFLFILIYIKNIFLNKRILYIFSFALVKAIFSKEKCFIFFICYSINNSDTILHNILYFEFCKFRKAYNRNSTLSEAINKTGKLL